MQAAAKVLSKTKSQNLFSVKSTETVQEPNHRTWESLPSRAYSYYDCRLDG